MNESDGISPDGAHYSYYADYSIYDTGSWTQNNGSGPSPGWECEFVPGSLSMRFFLGVVFSLVFVVCGVGDSLLCYLILSQQRLRTVTNLLIANLAASDAIVALICVPLALTYYQLQNWIWGEFMCRFLGTLKDVSFYVSINTLLVIAVDRYYGIFHPFRPRMQKATLITIVITIWVVSALLTVPNSISLGLMSGNCDGQWISVCLSDWKNPQASQVYTLFIAGMEFILPMLSMAFIYLSIALKLWFHRMPPGNVTARHREITVNRQQKTIPMLITVVVAFFICWAPYHTYMVLYQFISSGVDINFAQGYAYFFYIVEGIAMCNSIVSTIIYFGMSTGFRQELINFTKRILSWHYKDGQQTMPTGSQSSNAIARNGYPSAGRKITADTLDTKL